MKMTQRIAVLTATALALVAAATTASAGVVDVQGVPLDDTVVLGGQTLVLNGAGFRKRGYFKIDVTALYLTKRVSTVEAVETAPGAKRLELVIQKDISGSQASSFFLNDFEASAKPEEFKQLISEVSQVGSIYSGIRLIKKGDIVTLDIVPGKGCMASLNGQPLTPQGATTPWFQNDLLGKVLFRMYIGGKTPNDLRDNLLGVSYSMRDKPPTAAELAAAAKPAAPAPAASGAAAPKPAVAASGTR